MYAKSDGSQSHQCQQNEQLPLIRKTTAYVDRNPDYGFRQIHKCGGVKPIDGVAPTLTTSSSFYHVLLIMYCYISRVDDSLGECDTLG